MTEDRTDAVGRGLPQIVASTEIVGRVSADLLRDKRLVLGVSVIIGVGVVGILAPIIAPYSPTTSVADPLEKPSADHFFGTDSIGLDVFSRVVWGARLDLAIALGAVAVSLIVGVLLGMYGGYSDNVLSGTAARAADTIQAFPVFVAALALVAATGNSVSNLIIVIALLNAPIYFRLARGQTRTLRHTGFVEAAIVSGAARRRVLFRHVLPNAAGPLLAQASVSAGWALLLTAGLSFVGAGVRPPEPEWGAMIASGTDVVVVGSWWPTVFPGLSIMITVLAFALISESISDRVSGRSRR